MTKQRTCASCSAPMFIDRVESRRDPVTHWRCTGCGQAAKHHRLSRTLLMAVFVVIGLGGSLVSGSLTALEGPTTSERLGSLAIIAGLMAYVGYRLMLHARVSRNPQMSGT